MCDNSIIIICYLVYDFLLGSYQIYNNISMDTKKSYKRILHELFYVLIFRLQLFIEEAHK